ncbi:MAG: transcription antitermination factor NusB [Ruminococcus sp.]|nr:transcription antitermination factor NusB [Candidatus Copronaster equi]
MSAENRRKSREQAFIILFEKSFNEDMSFDEIINIAIEAEVIFKDEFMSELIENVNNNLAEIDDEIRKNLKGWTMARISKVSLALLRLAICEIKFLDSIPVGVSINEAVELSKKYGSDEDKSFVNGVLGSVSRSGE